MRHFNKREKDVIKILVSKDFTNVSSFSVELNKMFFNEENGVALVVDRSEKVFYLFIRNFEDQKRVKVCIGEFLELVNLLLYLSDNNLVNVLPYSNLPSFFLLHDTFRQVDSDYDGKCVLDGKGHYFNIRDLLYIYNREGVPEYKSFRFNGKYYDLVLNLLFGVIYPTAELYAFVERGNMTEEELRFKVQFEESAKQHRSAMKNAEEQLEKTKRSLNISYIALFISFVALIATLCSNLWMKTSIEPYQFQSVKNILEEIEKNTKIKSLKDNDNLEIKPSIIDMQMKEDSLNLK
ncbi:hypothetical protein [uncultured Coprobacter sp.]|jgi:hypothetical protein|uniref:hypothetical protein n=1 Tax=uncultured Coprobacter sp. TaxID=1720550 RepID=UPI0025CF359B|nr:hypothetical protein [uncultured Coprobacter sp.]